MYISLCVCCFLLILFLFSSFSSIFLFFYFYRRAFVKNTIIVAHFIINDHSIEKRLMKIRRCRFYSNLCFNSVVSIQAFVSNYCHFQVSHLSRKWKYLHCTSLFYNIKFCKYTLLENCEYNLSFSLYIYSRIYITRLLF